MKAGCFYGDCYSSQLWVVLSNVYGQLIVVMMIALCLAEVMDTPVPLLSLQVGASFKFVSSVININIKKARNIF